MNSALEKCVDSCEKKMKKVSCLVSWYVQVAKMWLRFDYGVAVTCEGIDY